MLLWMAHLARQRNPTLGHLVVWRVATTTWQLQKSLLFSLYAATLFLKSMILFTRDTNNLCHHPLDCDSFLHHVVLAAGASSLSFSYRYYCLAMMAMVRRRHHL